MKTVCKFKCEFVTNFQEGVEVKLTPVTSGSKENEGSFKWTPSGSMVIGLVNENVVFKPGSEYLLEISECQS